MCVFARLGQEKGLQISRAAFAVILKYTESVFEFNSLQD